MAAQKKNTPKTPATNKPKTQNKPEAEIKSPYTIYREEIEEALKVKMTLTDLELFDRIYDLKTQRRLHRVPSKMIKQLRRDGYAISQSRVFEIFKKLDKIEEEILTGTLKPADKKKLTEAQKKENELKEQIKKLQEEVNAAKKVSEEIKSK